jgi:hypothetical protein
VSFPQPVGKQSPAASEWRPSNVTVQSAKKGAKGGKKRRKRHPWWVAVAVSCIDDNNKQADSPDKEYIVAAE